MTQAPELSYSVVKSAEVIGVSVENPEGDSLGKIEELVIDKIEGKIRYAVLSFGGILGLGEKLFAIPWNVLHYNNERDCFIISVPYEKLKNAKGFDIDKWPNMADESWNTDIFKYYEEHTKL